MKTYLAFHNTSIYDSQSVSVKAKRAQRRNTGTFLPPPRERAPTAVLETGSAIVTRLLDVVGVSYVGQDFMFRFRPLNS